MIKKNYLLEKQIYYCYLIEMDLYYSRNWLKLLKKINCEK